MAQQSEAAGRAGSGAGSGAGSCTYAATDDGKFSAYAEWRHEWYGRNAMKWFQRLWTVVALSHG